MPAFDYSHAPIAIRPDLPLAYRVAWDRIAAPGSWWTGAERVAIAHEVRSARGCALCAERRAALSPLSIDGVHDGKADALPDAARDAVHRVTTDAARLTRAWVEKLAAAGVSDGHYVELLSVVVTVVGIDAFHHALGLPLEPLPLPKPGAPSGYRPPSATLEGAFVPMLSARDVRGTRDGDLYEGLPFAPHVLAALSLVPDGVRMWKGVAAAQYLSGPEVGDPSATGGRAISRAQMELVAGRVSALNECFY